MLLIRPAINLLPVSFGELMIFVMCTFSKQQEKLHFILKCPQVQGCFLHHSVTDLALNINKKNISLYLIWETKQNRFFIQSVFCVIPQKEFSIISFAVCKSSVY